jgi:hypothetical protein
MLFCPGREPIGHRGNLSFAKLIENTNYLEKERRSFLKKIGDDPHFLRKYGEFISTFSSHGNSRAIKMKCLSEVAGMKGCGIAIAVIPQVAICFS